MRRPLAVTILSWIYIVMGTVGFIYHLREFREPNALHSQLLAVEALRVLAVIAGDFMLRAKSWARWLAILWIGFHVGVSFFNSWQQVVMHSIFFVAITILLTRGSVNEYFGKDAVNA